jgi:PAS domain S-box-containing protein
MPDNSQAVSNDCVLAFNKDKNNYLFISPDVKSVLGFSITDFHQNVNLIYELIHENDRAWVKELTDKLCDNESLSLNYRVKTQNGDVKWVNGKKSLVVDQHTGDKVLITTVKDYLETGIKQPGTIDRAICDLMFLFDNSPNPMWIYDLSSFGILKANNAAVENYSYTQAEFSAMSPRDLHIPGDIEKFNNYVSQKWLSKVQSESLVYSGVWKHQSKRGRLIDVEIICQRVDYKGAECRIMVATDVTEKIRFEEELIGTKNSLEALINNTDDQIWSLDKETRYVYMNKSYRKQIARLTGVEPQEGDYSYLHAGYNEQIVTEWTAYYKRALDGERYTIINESIDPFTGQKLSFEISFNPIYKTKDKITGIGCFARDITDRLKTEKAIIDQNDRLRKIALLSSHELRRPMASMLGLINIMDRENFYNPENKQIIEHLLTVGNEMDEVLHLIVDKTLTDDLPANN